jgi:ribonuclease HII
MKWSYIIGIDEVGRGPIAGPVAVCSFKCKPNFFDSISIDTPLRDSKKLTKKQREKWFEYLKEEKNKGNCDFSVSIVSAEWIDKSGIVPSIKKALKTSLNNVISQDHKNLSRLTLSNGGSDATKDFYDLAQYKIFLDGGLKAPEEFIYQETIIKGDELHPVISCASIVAKVSRDNLMYEYAKKYPDYGFENHVGYGTKAHYEAIKKHGQTLLHRKTFIK